MATIGKVSAVFTANTSGLRTGVNQATAAMHSLERTARATASGMRSLIAIQGVQMFASVANQAARFASSLIDMGRAQADVIEQTGRIAERLGMTYREFTGIADAADLAGIGMDTVATGVTRAEVAFANAASGSRTAQEAFSRLGLSIDELNGMTPAERFQAIADAVASLPSEAERAAAAVALFGRSGAQLLPLFNAGAGAIRQATEAADRFGRSLTDAQARDVDAMGDSFQQAGQAINGVIQQVVAQLAPAITAIATEFTNFIGTIGGTNIGQAIGDGIVAGARYLAQIGDAIIENVPNVWQFAEQVATTWRNVFETGSRVAAFFMGIGDSLQAAFGIIILSISEPVQGLVEAARYIADALGIDTPLLDSWAAGADAFNESIAAGIRDNATSAAENFNRALFGRTEVEQAGRDLAGPLETGLDAMLAKARESAAAISQATAKPIEIRQTAAVSMEPVRKAVEGIDSRSAQGLKTMFRIMRGDTGNDVQERIARAVERTADAVEDQDGPEFEVVDLAPAAGA